MICGEVALAYQKGRDSGYDDGYEDGAIMFAKYLKQNSCAYDLNNYHSFNAIDVDDLDDFVKDFLENK